MNTYQRSSKKGFTLVELLVVITIIAVLSAVALTNFLGARERGKDVRKKAELQQMKNALQLYFTDYQQYPLPAARTLTTINGCGALGTSACTAGGSFCAGSTADCSGAADVVYMKRTPSATDFNWYYNTANSQANFCLQVDLDNNSDVDVARSQSRCASICTGEAATDYLVCSD